MLPQWLSGFFDGALAVAAPAGLLALTVSAVAVIAGWSRRREVLEVQGNPLVPARIALGQAPLAADALDVAAEAAALLALFEGFATQRFVALELAVQPGLAVRADPRALREILGDLVRRGIEQSPCGRVLLAAAHVGGRVQITVSDDGRQIDRAAQASRLRPAQRLAALQGATMDFDVRKGQGTTVVVRWPAGTGNRQPGAEAAPDPAAVWQAPSRARENSGAEQ
jgi:two-component system, cell cycle sensor histidine kinase PleC